MSVGVVVVDDTAEGLAESVAASFADRFPLGVVYRVSGAHNISVARNVGLEAALGFADWILMTDDDCEPADDWLLRMWSMRLSSGCDAVTGRLTCVVPDGSPRWLTAEPFLEYEYDYPPHGAAASIGSTHNSLISSQWLRDHRDVRFREDLGRIGGEDAVFYREARSAGLRIVFASDGVVYERLPAARTSYRYQLRRAFWHGNSSYVTAVEGGLATRNRMLVSGAKKLCLALVRPLRRLTSGRSPQWRYSVAAILHSAGTIAGRFGVRVRHG